MKVWACESYGQGWRIWEDRRLVARGLSEDNAKRICELHRIFQEFIHTRPTLDPDNDLDCVKDVIDRFQAEAKR